MRGAPLEPCTRTRTGNCMHIALARISPARPVRASRQSPIARDSESWTRGRISVDLESSSAIHFLNLLAAVALAHYPYPSAFARTIRIGTGTRRPFLLMPYEYQRVLSSVMTSWGTDALLVSCVRVCWRCRSLGSRPPSLYRPPSSPRAVLQGHDKRRGRSHSQN